MSNSKKKPKSNKVMICDNLDFILHEEYRLLRTNIKFSLSDEAKCYVIGVTSSVKGEAKTTTAINLAYTLAENEEKVCLIEADMRLPTFAKKNEYSGLHRIVRIFNRSGFCTGYIKNSVLQTV